MSHDRWLESAAGYALDALDAKERGEFEAHLASCGECRLTVQEYREVTGLLMHAAAPAPPPPQLGERVGRLISGERAPRRNVSPIRWRTSTVWLAAAGAAFAIAAGVLWRELAEEREGARAAQIAAETFRNQRDSALGSLRGPRVHVVSLASPSGGQPVARVFWNHERNRFFVTAFNLPPAREGRTYQLWAITKGHAPVSMGTFGTNERGIAEVILPVGQEIDALGFIDSCGLTEEPAGGSPAPTESPRYLGNWRHTD
ncbi:MAG TPA: anti-sigma factor [Gemmatimonadaceae bacterium]|jgi:anti-sigma-K factor RskA|nr:anti-sigma factor [Gemmatimonadaceae bacterium]